MSVDEPAPTSERRSIRRALAESYSIPAAVRSETEFPAGFFRLIVDLPIVAADALDELAAAYRVSPAEVTSRAIATELLVYRAERDGGRLYMQRGGRRYRLRRRDSKSVVVRPDVVEATATIDLRQGMRHQEVSSEESGEDHS